MDRIKVMIVDDHLVVREGLKQLLELEHDLIEVVGEASSGLECLKFVEDLAPDLIFMDVRMPGISGIETTRLVCQKYPWAKVIMLTIYDDEKYVAEAIEAGAKGYVLKKVSREELIKVIHHVMGDRSFLDPTLTDKLFDYVKRRGKRHGETGKSRLTGRELEVLQGIVAGDTDRGIAESLCISEHTVRSHIKSLYKKLGVSSKSQAVVKAMEEGIINRHA